MVVGLIVVAIIIGVLVVAILEILNVRFLLKTFRSCNVIVFGKKGTGKDLLFQKVINRRKEKCHANIPYGVLNDIVAISKLSVAPNTFKEVIEGSTVTVPRLFNDKEDFYISDAGIYLPSQYDSQLDKLYPSFPIFYALSRHLYDCNVHVNTQYLGRVWKKLREQADAYIMANGVVSLPFCLLCKFRYYERYQSADQQLAPMGKALMNSYNKAERNVLEAQNGIIKDGFYLILKKNIHYDTRYFEKVFFTADDIAKKSSKRMHH